MMEQHPPGIHPMYRKKEIVEAGYDDWNKKREKLPLDVLIGTTIVRIIGGNSFIACTKRKFYEINVDESAGDIDILDITELQKTNE